MIFTRKNRTGSVVYAPEAPETSVGLDGLGKKRAGGMSPFGRGSGDRSFIPGAQISCCRAGAMGFSATLFDVDLILARYCRISVALVSPEVVPFRGDGGVLHVLVVRNSASMVLPRIDAT